MSEPMTLEMCPFCGATDVEAYPADRERSRWNVCCGNPGCVTRGDNDYLTEGDAVAAWNRRHISQPAQQDNDDLTCAYMAGRHDAKQPAQAVDVVAINRVIVALEESARNGGNTDPDELESWASTLTAALKDSR
jgi:hypothetical protein